MGGVVDDSLMEEEPVLFMGNSVLIGVLGGGGRGDPSGLDSELPPFSTGVTPWGSIRFSRSMPSTKGSIRYTLCHSCPLSQLNFLGGKDTKL